MAKHRQFGRSSERSVEQEQLGLFNEIEQETAQKLAEPSLKEITYQRKKRVGKREADLAELPVEVIEYTLSAEEQTCRSLKKNRTDYHGILLFTPITT